MSLRVYTCVDDPLASPDLSRMSNPFLSWTMLTNKHLLGKKGE